MAKAATSTNKKKKKKKVPEKILTPTGVAQYPWLNRPDTQFNPDGEYKVNLILDLERPEVATLCEKLNSAAKRVFDKTVKEAKPQIKDKITMYVPFEPQFDDDGNVTGNIIVKFKQKAKLKNSATGETFEKKVYCFDAKKNLLDPVPAVFGGSILRVNFTPNEFYNTATKQAGISLRLNAVQIIELKTGGGASAGGYGFDEEEGFDSSDYEGAGSLDETDGTTDENPDF